MNTIELLIRIFDSISEWTGRIFSWIIVPMTLLVVVEVIARRIFHAPTIWSFEVVTQLYGFHFLILAAFALLYKVHIRVDVLSDRWSPRTQTIVDTVFYLTFFFPFVGIILWKGTIFALNSWAVREISISVFHPPLYPIKTVIPIAAGFLILQGLSEFIRNLVFITKGVKL